MSRPKPPKNPKASKGSSLGPFGFAWGQDKNTSKKPKK